MKGPWGLGPRGFLGKIKVFLFFCCAESSFSNKGFYEGFLGLLRLYIWGF